MFECAPSGVFLYPVIAVFHYKLIFMIFVKNIHGVNMDEIPSKICRKCGICKYHFEFNHVSKSYDGLNSSCKACIKKAYDERRKRDDPPKAKDYPYS